MIKFNRSRRGIEIDAQSLILRCLCEIWESDGGDEKRNATRIIAFIHIVAQVDVNAPYYSAKYDEVRELVARDQWGEAWQVHIRLEQFDQQIADYQAAYDTVEQRAKRMMDKKIDEQNDMIINTRPVIEKSINVNTGAFTWQNNTKALSGAIKDVGVMIKERDAMIERLKNEERADSTIRGEKKLSFLESKRRDKETRIRNEQEEQQAVQPTEEQEEVSGR